MLLCLILVLPPGPWHSKKLLPTFSEYLINFPLYVMLIIIHIQVLDKKYFLITIMFAKC